jgi:hypothetical protein
MLEEYRIWIRRHLNVVLSFLIGMAFGLAVLSLAFFSNRSTIAGDILNYGVRVTGHADIDEDLIWLFCGIVIGASVTCLAWWRDNHARTVGLRKEDVLNRLFADPTGKGTKSR